MAISHGDAAPRCPDIVGNATEEARSHENAARVQLPDEIAERRTMTGWDVCDRFC